MSFKVSLEPGKSAPLDFQGHEQLVLSHAELDGPLIDELKGKSVKIVVKYTDFSINEEEQEVKEEVEDVVLESTLENDPDLTINSVYSIEMKPVIFNEGETPITICGKLVDMEEEEEEEEEAEDVPADDNE